MAQIRSFKEHSMVFLQLMPNVWNLSIIIANKRSWGRTQMARRLFEQHEQTKKHKNHGRRPGQTAVTKYTTEKPVIEYSNLSISLRIQAAWWLAKENVAIEKFGSLVKSKLATHKYDSFITNYLQFKN
jgi:hypothetical protein